MRFLFLLIVAALGFVTSSASAQGVLVGHGCPPGTEACIPRPEPIVRPTPSRPVIIPPPTQPHRQFELKSYDVKVAMNDELALTTVTHVFVNPLSVAAEAVFYFPIPEGATTTEFALWMNGERVEGSVLPRDEARSIYESIVRATRDPGLLEYVNGELFQASIFPIPPGGEQKVEIQYATPLGMENGAIHYALPIDERVAKSGVNVQIHGEIRSTQAIGSVYSPAEALEIVTHSPHATLIAFEGDGASLNKSVDVFVAREDGDLAYSLLTWSDDAADEAGYFMLSLMPGAETNELERLPKQVTFVLDTSGSMRGGKWTQSVNALKEAIASLHNDDHFNIVAFSGQVTSAFEQSVLATARGKRQGLEFVETLHASGGTNISGALEVATAQKEEPGRPHTILFLTDGEPSVGITQIGELLAFSRRAMESDQRRLFVFGVGYDVNTRLLDGMAEDGRGRSDYVRPLEDVEEKVVALMNRMGSPLLTSPQLRIRGVRVTEMYPEALPDLYAGENITVVGRYEGNASARVQVQARAGTERVEREWRANFGSRSASTHRFVANIWASRKVAALLRHYDNAPSDALREEITSIAQRFNIVTPFTSYLAVEERERARLVRSPAPMEMMVRFSAPTAMGGGVQAEAPVSFVGAHAVETAIARRELADADRVSVARPSVDSTHRSVSGRSFERWEAGWRESGVEEKNARRVTFLSDEWFALQRRSPELREILALGEQLLFRHEGRVILVSP